MSATVYLGQAARDQVAAAQARVDGHLAGTATGRCARCGEVTPCLPLLEAVATLARYGALPKRRPGATGAPSGPTRMPRPGVISRP